MTKMNIAMFTNAYKPIIGGVERSIETFAEDLDQMGHRVLIVTLQVAGAEQSEETIFRLPAIKKVGGTEFSVKLPVPTNLRERLDDFRPDVIHSHHPFMLGDTAIRVARRRGLPLVFTHHTLYERYTYLFKRDSEALQRVAMAIATEYANLCDLVVAPTGSIERMTGERGVQVPIEIIPSGVDVAMFSGGRRQQFRKEHGIPEHAFTAGYLGRVVEAKNMRFLAEAGALFLARNKDARFLIVGDGESAEAVKSRFSRKGVADRLVTTGSLTGEAVADAYSAMDVFAFASKTDTQGIVLIESFCAGIPVVALDASGSRDIVENGENGAVLPWETSPGEFAEKLVSVADDPDLLKRWSRSAIKRSLQFDRRRCAERLERAYRRLKRKPRVSDGEEPQIWDSIQQRFNAEWDLFRQKLTVAAAALTREENERL
ncbi:MAG: glycosyltransferase [Kiritimatiellia bacterium]